MYISICAHSFIIVISSFFGVVFGMEKERLLIEAVRKDIIPVLALNNYVVPVPNAYCALKKEASMTYASIEAMHHIKVKTINKRRRERMRHANPLVYKIFTQKGLNKEQRTIGASSYRRIELICESSLPDAHLMNATITMTDIAYIVRFLPSSPRYSVETVGTLKNAGMFWKGMVERFLPKGQPLHIEICSHGNISDWITVENCFQLSNDPPSMELLQDSSCAVCENNLLVAEKDIVLLMGNRQKIEFLSHIITVVFALLAGIFVGMSF